MSKFKNVFSEEDLSEHIKDYHDNLKQMSGPAKKYPVYLTVNQDEEEEVRFLEETPVRFWQHRVYDENAKNGAGSYRVFSCTREPDCPLCAAGNQASFKVAWQVVHLKDQNRVKLWVKGITFSEVFVKKIRKFDITDENVTLERVGTGSKTTYLLERTGDTGPINYDKSEVVDLRDFFGIDEQKYKDMVRIGEAISDKGSPSQATSQRGEPDMDTKLRAKSRLVSDSFEEDGDVIF